MLTRAKLLAPLGRLLIAALRRSMRVRHAHAERMDALLASGKPFVLAFWHSQLMMMVYAYRAAPSGIAPMVSRHRDGGYIAAVMEAFGHPVIRGSSRRGGVEALREAVRSLREGRSVAFTPDGPRGPRREAQAGAIQAARMAGVPVLPMAFAASKKKSCIHGTALKYLIPSRAASFSTASPLRCRGAWTKRGWNPSACAWSAS